MIDLHMHTTASDGRCAPDELVRRAAAAGIGTIAVTDHDTMAGVLPAVRAAETCGIRCLPGIEITAVHEGKDVHVLAYFLPHDTPGLQTLLASQRQQRVDRAREIVSRLDKLQVPVDAHALVEAGAASGKSLARPQIAQALIAAGHVKTVAEAFERYLAEDAPAYVPQTGVSPSAIVSLVVAGGGIPSLAHPGYRPRDEIIPGLVEAGMVALEAYHSSHDAEATAHYLAIARRYGLLVTGGSDYHGPGTRREEFFGVTSLPERDLDSLLERAGQPRRE